MKKEKHSGDTNKFPPVTFNYFLFSLSPLT